MFANTTGRGPGHTRHAAALVLAGILTAGCGSNGAAPTAPPPTGNAAAPEQEPTEAEDAIAVRVERVAQEPLSSLYSTSATLRADRRATVTARTRGVIRSLQAEEGDRVRAGQTLAVLEDDEQKIEAERTASARDTRLRELERAASLHDQELLSDEGFETTRREADEARQTAALAELVLSRTRIRAPFDGVVLTRHLDAGNNVNDGDPVFEIADLEPLRADVHVPERQIARVSAGQTVRLVTDDASAEADARIERIAPAVDASTGTVKVTLTVGDTGRLRPGSFVRVEIVTDTHTEALALPRAALVAEGRRWHVFRLDEAGRNVERLEVTRGFEEEDRVEVLETHGEARPLAAGDRVVVVGAAALSDGARVQVAGADDDVPGSAG